MNYYGLPPQKIILCQRGLTLPSGEEIAGAYGFDERGKPGFLKVNVELAQKHFKSDEPFPDSIAAATIAAHEAVEHVNFMRGKEVLVANRIIPLEVHRKSETEQEANRIARQIILRRYGLLVHFADELPLTLKDKFVDLANILDVLLERKKAMGQNRKP